MKVLLATIKRSPRLGKFKGWMEGELRNAGDGFFNVIAPSGNVLIANLSVEMLNRERAAGRIIDDEPKESFYSRVFDPANNPCGPT